MKTDRRKVLKGLGASTAALGFPHVGRAQVRGQIVVIGGGFGGATAARYLSHAGHDVTLVERDATYFSCPFSNTVLGGMAGMGDITFQPRTLSADGVRVVQGEAVGIADGTVTLSSGEGLPYDRVLMSPGVDMIWGAIPGYDEAAAEIMPHAWKAGKQTQTLRSQLEAMEDGGLVVIAPPANPYRCPPGPYERASLIAHFLKAEKPRSRILILDAKESFSKQALFEQAWDALYPGMIEWIPPSMGGRVASVEADTMTVVTDFNRYDASVANIIPPQRAAAIAQAAGVVDETGWCPVSGLTFESDLVPGIHVVGDACFPGAMPKSAFSANAQAKVAAAAIDALLRDESPVSPKLLNTCYSLAAPDYGFTVAGVYGEAEGKLFEVEGAGGVSPIDADNDVRVAEAEFARSWYATITNEAFG